MEYRQLGYSGLKVPVLSLGVATFGGGNEFFRNWGETQVEEASRLIDLCLEAGANLFDTANVYSHGLAEEILGKAIAGRRHQMLLSTKATFPMGDGPNDKGSSRHHLTEQCHASLRRLGTDYIDIYHMHGFDALTPVEKTLETLDTLVKQGKIRYIAASNFSGWHLMKSLAASERHSWQRYVAHQVYYSLVSRDYEWELMPLALDQKVGALVWSPLGWGRLTGRIRRGQPAPKDSRIGQGGDTMGPVVEGVPVHGRRCAGRGGSGDRQNGAAGCAQLGYDAPHGGKRDCRRSQRGAAEGEPGLGRLDAERGADRKTGCGERASDALPLLAPGQLPRAHPAAGAGTGQIKAHSQGPVVKTGDHLERSTPASLACAVTAPGSPSERASGT